MVQGILKTLSSSVRGLHQAAYLLAGLTLVSQVLALLRDRTFADAFGAGQTLDLYYAAFRVPDLVFALVSSLVSAYVLIPRIADARKEEGRALLSQAASFLVIAGGALCVVLAFCMPQLVRALFPQFAGSAALPEFVLVSRMLLIQPIVLGLSGIFTSVTQLERRFVLFALSPVLYNLGIIAGVVFLYPHYGLPGIAAGVVLGALAHLVIHIPVVIGARLAPSLVLPSPARIWSIVRDSVPRSLALSFGAVTTLFLTVMAARISSGSVSVLTLAGNLEAVPLSLIGASYATAAFPVLSEEANAGKSDAFKATLTAAARHVIFWSSVAAVLIIVLRAHIVRVILGSGAFDWEATRLTAALLGILSVALAAQGFILLASRAFYATKRSWNPLILQVLGLGITVASALGLLALSEAAPDLRYFLEALLRIDDTPSATVIFLALGATLGQLATGALALATLGTVARGVVRSLVRPFFEGAGAAIVGGAAAYGVLHLFGALAPLTSLSAVFTQGFLAGMVGLAVSALILVLLENKEFRDLYEALRKLTGTALPPSGTVLTQ